MNESGPSGPIDEFMAGVFRHTSSVLVLLGFVSSSCLRDFPQTNTLLLLEALNEIQAVQNRNNSTESTSPTVSATSPAEGDTNVAINTGIAVTFSKAMRTSTVTTNTFDANCSGSLQVSSDAFATCVQMLAAPVVSAGDTVFTVTPAANLSGTTAYRIRVTANVTDSTDVAMASQYVMGTDFTTAAGPDLTPPNVNSTTPADTTTGIATGTTVAVHFTEAMNTGTLTTNTANTLCSGSFQVSNDGFTTCVQMNAAPVASAGNTVFTVTPLASLAAASTYQIRITTGVQDAAGNNLAVQFTTATGFTTTATAPKRIFITSVNHDGDFDNDGALAGGFFAATNGDGNGIPEADNFCDTNATNPAPGTGAFKALLVDGTYRIASPANGQWVLAASTAYYRLDATTPIFTTDAARIFTFGTFTNSFANSTNVFYSGLNGDWTTGNHCTRWTNANPTGGGPNQGTKGTDDDSILGSALLDGGAGNPHCSFPQLIVCVEQ